MTPDSGRSARTATTFSTSARPHALTATPPLMSPSARPPEAGQLYDARRGVYYVKPAFRGWLHLLWFVASLAGGPLLLSRAHGAAQTTAIAVYSISVSALFGISALYHRGTWTVAWRQRLQRLDHAMIFFLIAGTATPAFLLTAPGAFGLTCLIALWALTVITAAILLVWMSAPELLVGVTFVGLGCAAGLALPWVWIHAGVAPAALMLAGGLLYVAGALSYHRRRPDPYPSVFGYHEVFHLYVCAAAACQYVAIARFIA
jgi:hemolysin III